jgi:uncharacterized protein (TIGR00369 family)
MSASLETPGPLSAKMLEATIDEQAGHCFGCGPNNVQGLKLHFVVETSPHITARALVQLTRTHEGAEGYLHGGIIATLMDEVMSKLNRPLGVLAMTRHMEVDYLRPAAVETALRLTGRHDRREGRKLFHTAELTAEDGTLLARSKALFVVVDPEKLRQEQAKT